MLVIVNIICAVLGFYSLFKYTKGDYEVAMTDVVMERKFDTVRVGVSMFVHSMKNQLLANKVIYKRIDPDLQSAGAGYGEAERMY